MRGLPIPAKERTQQYSEVCVAGAHIFTMNRKNVPRWDTGILCFDRSLGVCPSVLCNLRRCARFQIVAVPAREGISRRAADAQKDGLGISDSRHPEFFMLLLVVISLSVDTTSRE